MMVNIRAASVLRAPVLFPKGSFANNPLMLMSQPLVWVKNSDKGRVTHWRMENAQGVDYEIEYLPGPQNIVADACSRYPMLGPKVLTRLGLEHAFKCLLDFLPDEVRSVESCWLHAGKDTDLLARALQRWRVSPRIYHPW